MHAKQACVSYTARVDSKKGVRRRKNESMNVESIRFALMMMSSARRAARFALRDSSFAE